MQNVIVYGALNSQPSNFEATPLPVYHLGFVSDGQSDKTGFYTRLVLRNPYPGTDSADIKHIRYPDFIQYQGFDVSADAILAASALYAHNGFLGQGDAVRGLPTAPVSLNEFNHLQDSTAVAVQPFVYRGNEDKARVKFSPTNYANAIINAGAASVTVLTVGFQVGIIFGYQIGVTADAATAVAGNVTISLGDATTPDKFGRHVIFVPATAVTSQAGNAYVSPWHALPDGIETGPGQDIIMSLDTVLSTGLVWITMAVALRDNT